jgi:hypothetical protein
MTAIYFEAELASSLVTSSQSCQFDYVVELHRLTKFYRMPRLIYTPQFQDFGYSVAGT